MEYFEFYGITPSLFIDESALRKAFIAKQREWHPDFFTGDPAAYETAMEHTTLNNQAYKALSEFYPRLEYILNSKGLVTKEKGNVLTPEFLMDMMDLNDLIEDGKLGNENASKEAAEQLANLCKANDAFLQTMAQSKYLPEDSTNPFWNQLLEFYQKVKYLNRLQKNLDGIEEI